MHLQERKVFGKYRLKDKILFGQYQNKSILWILHRDPKYLQWCLETIEDFKLNQEASEKLKSKLEDLKHQKKAYEYSPELEYDGI